uniref:G_PROTEIN_RECEP_F1_2 domain-containing protein n=2 Tax=Caenorhabditis tropicalis TaxID=1561998 RepID=A0A1I7V2L2_9PELO
MGSIWKVTVVLPIPIMCSNGPLAENASIVFQFLPILLIYTGISALSLFIYRMEAVIVYRYEPSKLRRFVYQTKSFSIEVQWLEQLFSKIGAFLNLFHLFFLTRKSMMTSSVNSIMIGIALCDLLSMCNVIKTEYMTVNPMGTECTPPPSLIRMNIDWLLTSIQNGLRRCSSWLGVLIALVRYLVISNIMNTRVASSGFGFQLLSISFLISSFFSALFFYQFHFEQISVWNPDATCPGPSAPVYGQSCNKLFEMEQGLFHRIQLVVEGVLGKIMPCILLPILTGLLLLKLSAPERTAFRNSRFAHHQDRITSLVIYIAITYLITEFPLGIVYIIDAIWHNDPVIGQSTKKVEILCNTIFTLNASLHCLLCFAMSTSYRKTVGGVLSFVKLKKKTTTSIVSRIT